MEHYEKKISFLGENIQTIRKHRGMKQQELADIDNRNNIPDTSPQLDFNETDYQDYLKEKWNRGL